MVALYSYIYSTSCLAKILAGLFLRILNNGNNPTNILTPNIIKILKPIVWKLTINNLEADWILVIDANIYVMSAIPGTLPNTVIAIISPKNILYISDFFVVKLF